MKKCLCLILTASLLVLSLAACISSTDVSYSDDFRRLASSDVKSVGFRCNLFDETVTLSVSQTNTVIHFLRSLEEYTGDETPTPEWNEYGYQLILHTISGKTVTLDFYDNYWDVIVVNDIPYTTDNDFMMTFDRVIDDILADHYDDYDREFTAAKPIIYLYPQEETDLTVTLGKPDKLTCSYPLYEDGWTVRALSDGTLTDLKTGRELYALYWEGIESEPTVLQDGFVVSGEESAAFLEDKLTVLGLSAKEAEEFIVYWLPQLQQNAYNLIHFATPEEAEAIMPLSVSEEPDTLIRVYMLYEALDAPVSVREQALRPVERTGFTVVEWGGIETVFLR